MREGTEVFTVDMGTPEDMTNAKTVGEILETTYPGYLWMVASSSGDLIIKNALLSQFGQYGFVIDGSKIISPTDLTQKAIMAGGELLERCGLPRSGWNGDMPTFMEGADPKWRRPM